jgi:alginate O-acetyltransferase complex protein AlgI
MLFNSYIFLFVFLPSVLCGFALFGRAGAVAGAAWLALASVTFYAWWNWRFALLLGASILINFHIGNAMLRRIARRESPNALLALGIAIDLAALGYFKYANFAAANVAQLFHTAIDLPEVVLPIGISFFTFTQIAYLVDIN